MYESVTESIHYQCPGKHSPINSQESNKIHFPERPKSYPLDICVDVDQRESTRTQ